MFHLFVFGLLLGWGAAIPIGAINLEMIRRNLRWGTGAGIGLGIGASVADVTYLALLSIGVLHILTHPIILKITGVVGSLLLAWFGYQALRLTSKASQEARFAKEKSRSFSRHALEGYLLTLINPFTILFWSSISVTLAVISHSNVHYALFYALLGVFMGTLSWVSGLNLFLHFTRHRLSPSVIDTINKLGGIILLGFALLGFWRVLTT